LTEKVEQEGLVAATGAVESAKEEKEALEKEKEVAPQTQEVKSIPTADTPTETVIINGGVYGVLSIGRS